MTTMMLATLLAPLVTAFCGKPRDIGWARVKMSMVTAVIELWFGQIDQFGLQTVRSNLTTRFHVHMNLESKEFPYALETRG